MVKLAGKDYAYSINTCNSFSLLSFDGKPLPTCGSVKAVNAAVPAVTPNQKVVTPKVVPSAIRSVPIKGSANKVVAAKPVNEEVKRVRDNRQRTPRLDTRESKNGTGAATAGQPNVVSKQNSAPNKEPLETENDSPESKDQRYRGRKDDRRDLGPKGVSRRNPDKRMFDRDEHSNVLLGRGKRVEKRQGKGPYNWGERVVSVKEVTPVSTVGVTPTAVEKVETETSHAKQGYRNNKNYVSTRESSVNPEAQPMQEEDSYSLDEYKLKIEKLRIRPVSQKTQAKNVTTPLEETTKLPLEVASKNSKSSIDSRVIRFDESVSDAESSLRMRGRGGYSNENRRPRRNKDFAPRNMGDRASASQGDSYRSEKSNEKNTQPHSDHHPTHPQTYNRREERAAGVSSVRHGGRFNKDASLGGERFGGENSNEQPFNGNSTTSPHHRGYSGGRRFNRRYNDASAPSGNRGGFAKGGMAESSSSGESQSRSSVFLDDANEFPSLA